jgi:hypothetical protein
MKIRRTIISLATFSMLIFGLIVCLETSAAAQKVRLRGELTPSCTEVRSGAGPGIKFADLYGDGNIAVQGSYNCNGVFIYDISNPDSPVLASWYNPGNNQQFLEAIVIGNRGYFGSGTGNGGVHIVDLTNPYNPVLLGTVDSTHGNGHNIIHEMLVFDQNGSRYLIENYNSTLTKPLRVIDVTNPASPVFKWEFLPTGNGWVHNMHIRGNWMFTSQYSGSLVELYDISNLASQAPTFKTSITSNSTNHSSWTSEDGSYLYSARETFDGDLRVYDVRPLYNSPPQPAVLVRSIKAGDLGINAVTPHNPVVLGNKLYVAWYQAGIQVFDISNPANPVRIGQYDTFPNQFAPTAEEVQKLQNQDPWDMYCGGVGLQNSALPSNYDGAWAVYPFLGDSKVLAGDVRLGLLILDATKATAPLENVVSDFDGDGKTDLSVYTPSTGLWTVEKSSDGSQANLYWGLPTDVVVTGDYDGDGKSDYAVWRPSNGVWYIYGSSSGVQIIPWGSSGDIPVAADFDADGKTDLAVWRPSNGVWYIRQSTLGFRAMAWGTNGDKPLVGDYEGDGKPDIAVWRPSNGVWYILPSSSSIPMYFTWGTNGDRPVWADFDGDLKSDITVYRPSTGVWYILRSTNGSFLAYQFGLAEDQPIPADYDGDGKADISVFRPSTSVWYRIDSSTSAFFARVYGQSGDTVSPSSVQPQ